MWLSCQTPSATTCEYLQITRQSISVPQTLNNELQGQVGKVSFLQFKTFVDTSTSPMWPIKVL